MDNHEKALMTYAALQKRKELREKKKQRDADCFKIENIMKANKRKYRDFHAKNRVY